MLAPQATIYYQCYISIFDMANSLLVYYKYESNSQLRIYVDTAITVANII